MEGLEAKSSIHQKLKPPHVVIVPTPGLGHLIPLVELAQRLVVHHNFTVTFFIPNDGSQLQPQKKLLEALPPAISYAFLPQVNFDDLPHDVVSETKIVLTLTRSLSALRDAVKLLAESTRVVAIVVDIFGWEAFDVAKEFNVLFYYFFSTNAMGLWFLFELPKLDETTSCEYRDLPEPIHLPGCVPLHGPDFVMQVQERSNEAYRATVNMSKWYRSANGIIVNSFADLEPGALMAFSEQRQVLGIPPVHAVGPVVNSNMNPGRETGSKVKTGEEADVLGEHECLSWLNSQPEGSVLFVSFGSGGTLSSEQMNELALGLEMSGVRFLWVVRCPNENSTSATYFGDHGSNDPSSFLPLGFMERTKDVGLVLPSWAPQLEILSHRSTGGFLTHCGWNSIMESLMHGVPLIAWPLYAEQKMNAVLVSEDIKVAWRVKMNEKGIVESRDIEKYAKNLIEGDEGKLLKKKMMELKEAANIALSQDGSSTRSLAEVAGIWNSHMNYA
ncbi:PREDICTED: hydroquinone glucosyltransferase-like [Fragaria vesca subsp. vesca]|uniref:hydroquinone glucosyltransferase-like n=1 Tax=Fragaria vesca subsp. vesca TaxID=101020 RepID=UPI0002C3674E|nr:PREDICTED: hydroquinone glucosyltransferase-like [Fragaria vesca subsp. vesca]